MAMSRALARFEETRWVTKPRRFSFDFVIASCMADSSNNPSWTSRWARPPNAMRLVLPTAAIALSFMDLSQTPERCFETTIGSERINCQMKLEWSHIDATGRVTSIAKRIPTNPAVSQKGSPSVEGLPRA